MTAFYDYYIHDFLLWLLSMVTAPTISGLYGDFSLLWVIYRVTAPYHDYSLVTVPYHDCSEMWLLPTMTAPYDYDFCLLD